jgi:hypothetical protein
MVKSGKVKELNSILDKKKEGRALYYKVIADGARSAIWMKKTELKGFEGKIRQFEKDLKSLRGNSVCSKGSCKTADTNRSRYSSVAIMKTNPILNEEFSPLTKTRLNFDSCSSEEE